MPTKAKSRLTLGAAGRKSMFAAASGKKTVERRGVESAGDRPFPKS
jgi:hypothetical protein